jgi:hypothetical protein
MKHDIFISFKNLDTNGEASKDSIVAREIYTELTKLKLSTFFSPVSIRESGKSNWDRAIETALVSSRILILVGSSREHIDSPQVEEEWRAFQMSMRGSDRQFFILNCGKLDVSKLPLKLKTHEVFQHNELPALVETVANSMRQKTKLDDFVKVSLHSLHPEKNEDKVYFMTECPGLINDTFIVTAYWGPRMSKRLNSQIKVSNVSATEAKKEVEKAKLEKLRSGYAPKPFAKLITNDARAHLAAALSLNDVLTQPISKAVTKPTTKAKPTATAKAK